VFTASEAANAIDELAKAGLSTADVLSGALAGSLALASAGELGVARAAEITATSLQQFGLDGAQASHVADVLAAGAGKAMGSVDDLAQGLKFVGPVAASMGISIEETTGVLALFAQQGIIGEQAGTSLRGVLSSLTAPSAQARGEIEKLGLSLYDSEGNFLGMQNAAGQLSNAYSGMDDAARNASMGIIFGRETITAATALYQGGAEGVAEWTDAVDDSGFAAETARLKLDNLAGDVEKMGGAFDTALIQTGSAGNDVLREMVQTITGLIDGFNAMPAPVQTGTLVVGALVAGVGLLGGAFLTIVPKIAAARASMEAMNMTGGRLAKMIGKGGLILAGLTVLTVGLSGLGQTASLSSDRIADLDSALANMNMDALNKQFKEGRTNAGGMSEALTALTSGDFMKNQGANVGFGKFMAGLGIDTFYKELRESEAAFKQFGSTLAQTANSDLNAANEQFKGLVKEAGGGKEAARQLLVAMPDYAAALRNLALEQGVALDEQGLINFAMGEGSTFAQLAARSALENTSALGEMSAGALDATESITDLASALENFNSAQFTADEAMSAFRQSVLDIAAAMGEEGFSGTLDETTQQGIDNNRMLRELAESTNVAAAKNFELTGSQESANSILAAGRDELGRVGAAFGLSGDALQMFIDKYIASPKDLSYQANVTGIGEAQAAIDNFLYLNSLKKINIGVRTYPDSSTGGFGGGGITFADGGFTGRGGKYEPAGIVHKEEFVSTKETLAHPSNRAALEFMHAGGVMSSLGGVAASYAGAPPVVFASQAAAAGGAGRTENVTEYLVLKLDNKTIYEGQRQYTRAGR
jgi:TP901 family phage tail tape measure protein